MMNPAQSTCCSEGLWAAGPAANTAGKHRGEWLGNADQEWEGVLLCQDGEERGVRLNGVSMWARLCCTEELYPELLDIQLLCPQHREDWSCWRGSRGGHGDALLWSQAWESWRCLSGEEKAPGRPQSPFQCLKRINRAGEGLDKGWRAMDTLGTTLWLTSGCWGFCERAQPPKTPQPFSLHQPLVLPELLWM